MKKKEIIEGINVLTQVLESSNISLNTDQKKIVTDAIINLIQLLAL